MRSAFESKTSLLNCDHFFILPLELNRRRVLMAMTMTLTLLPRGDLRRWLLLVVPTIPLLHPDEFSSPILSYTCVNKSIRSHIPSPPHRRGGGGLRVRSPLLSAVRLVDIYRVDRPRRATASRALITPYYVQHRVTVANEATVRWSQGEERPHAYRRELPWWRIVPEISGICGEMLMMNHAKKGNR